MSHQRLQSLHPSRPGGCDGGRSARSGGSPWRRKTAFRRASARSAPRVQFAQTLLAQLPRCPATGDARFRDRPRDLHSVRSHPVPAARPKTHYTPRRPAPPPHRAASLSLDTPKTRRTTVLGLVLGLMRSNHLNTLTRVPGYKIDPEPNFSQHTLPSPPTAVSLAALVG